MRDDFARHARRTVIAYVMLAVPALHAQCPDGTPPPCAGTRKAVPPASRLNAVPAAASRARHLLLLPFRNITRGPAQEWLVNGAPVMLASALGQYADLQVVPEERLASSLRRVSLQPDAVPDAEQLRRIADETGGWTAVSGTVVATGGRMHVSVQALDIATTKVLTRAEGDVAADGDVRPAFDTLAARLLTVTGLTSGGSVDLGALTTRSVPAYRLYLNGLEAMRRADGRAAIDAFSGAVRLDSTFTLAWARLAHASILWDERALTDPRSVAYQAVQRATQSARQLPMREKRGIRALEFAFQGRMGETRAILDSLISDPADLDAREYLAVTELRDFVLVDSTARQPQLRGSRNRAVRLLEGVLEREPGRRSAFHWLAVIYSELVGGVSGQPQLPGYRRDVPSLAALFKPTNFVPLVPVLRDSIETITMPAWLALSRAQRSALLQRAAARGAEWTDRWRAVAPDDPAANWFASIFATHQGHYARALEDLDLAASPRLMVPAADVATVRARVLLALGHYGESIRLTDSLRAQPGLPAASIQILAQTSIAARLLAGQWVPAALAADSAITRLGALVSTCSFMAGILSTTGAWALPSPVRVAVMDTVAAHFLSVARSPKVDACALVLATGLAMDSLGLRRERAASGALRLVDSLEGAAPYPGADAELWRSGGLFRLIDSAKAEVLSTRPRLVRVAREMSLARRFEPGGFVVAGDSVTVSWHFLGPLPMRWDAPGFYNGWAFRARVNIVSGADTTPVLFLAERAWAPGFVEASGGLSDLAAAVTQKGATFQNPVLAATPTWFAGQVRADGDVLRLVVRGAIVDMLRGARPATAQFGLVACVAVSGGLCDSPTVPIEYRQ